MLSSTSEDIFKSLPKELYNIQDKIFSGQRITEEEGLVNHYKAVKERVIDRPNQKIDDEK